MGLVTFDSNKIPVHGVFREVVNEQLEIEERMYHMTCLVCRKPTLCDSNGYYL